MTYEYAGTNDGRYKKNTSPALISPNQSLNKRSLCSFNIQWYGCSSPGITTYKNELYRLITIVVSALIFSFEFESLHSYAIMLNISNLY